MLDVNTIEDLVRQEITRVVDQHVATILSDRDWADALEQKISKFVQDRIAAKFANISTMPDLVLTVKNSVSSIIEQGHLPGIDQYVGSEKITAIVDNSIQDLVSRTIDQMTLDSDWLSKIQKLTDTNMTAKVTGHLRQLDLNEVIVKEIDAGISRWQERLLKNFRTNGISDVATSKQLTVMDDAVVAEQGFGCQSLWVESDATISGTVTVQNLAVKGTINTDNRAWRDLANSMSDATLQRLTDEWRTQLVAEVIDLAKTQGIEFSQINVDGKPLVDGNRLNSSVTLSSLTQVGELDTLSVKGLTQLADTVTVKNKRIGINTQEPEMAFSVWDEEVSLIAGKLAKQQGYLGTARLQNLAIGVNRVPQIELDADGTTTIKKLRLERHRISFGTQVPNYSGTRGDIVFNSDPKPDTAFAWQCLGGLRWQVIKGIV